ncbi:MAG: Tfp pilus assembly protein FimT/FimU [Akkermansiaceae bacterium]
MCSGYRHLAHASRRGFTLLEMVIVLAIVSAIALMVVLDSRNVDEEQRLRESAGSVEALAKRARNIAIVQQRAYQLTISESAISIAPQYQRETGSGIDIESADGEQNRTQFEDITDSEETNSAVTYEIRRWGSDDWQIIEKDKQVVVTIDPTGLVEPISIRCSVGNSWLIQELHPLTAGVRDEQMNIDSE